MISEIKGEDMKLDKSGRDDVDELDMNETRGQHSLHINKEDILHELTGLIDIKIRKQEDLTEEKCKDIAKNTELVNKQL